MNNPIHAFCDSLCEPNPGEMHVGFWAKNTNTKETLFAKHRKIGHGTCNEAEYWALFTIVGELEKTLGQTWPEVTIYSDSQLMTKQVNGVWQTTKPEIVALHTRAKALQAQFGFKVQWIPREQNALADALAQETRLKGSGRRFTLEDGRLRVHRNTPCVEIFSDKEMHKLLHSPRLIQAKHNLEGHIENDGSPEEIKNCLEEIRGAAVELQGKVPILNELVQNWLHSTFALLDATLEEMLEITSSGDHQATKDTIASFLGGLQGPKEEEVFENEVFNKDVLTDLFDEENLDFERDAAIAAEY